MPTYLQRVITRLEVPLSTTENLPVHWFVLQLCFAASLFLMKTICLTTLWTIFTMSEDTELEACRGPKQTWNQCEYQTYYMYAERQQLLPSLLVSLFQVTPQKMVDAGLRGR